MQIYDTKPGMISNRSIMRFIFLNTESIVLVRICSPCFNSIAMFGCLQQ